MNGPDPLPLADAMARLRRRLGLPPPGELETVLAEWEDVVGPDLAPLLRPDQLRDGVLVVVGMDPAVVEAARWKAGAWTGELRQRGAPSVLRVEVRTRRRGS